MKIKEVIVVEGKNDTNKLKSIFDVDTIETHGTCISEFTINLIKKAHEENGVIVLTDPDFPGNKIRNILDSKIYGLKHVYLRKQDALGNSKVGVEHASDEVIIDAFKHVISYKENSNILNNKDLIELRIYGNKKLRDYLCFKLHIGKNNNKSLLKKLNMLNISKNEIKEVLNDFKY